MFFDEEEFGGCPRKGLKDGQRKILRSIQSSKPMLQEGYMNGDV